MSFESLMENLGRAVRRAIGPAQAPNTPYQTTNRPSASANAEGLSNDEIEYREGRYIVGGYSWGSRAQAEQFSRRLDRSRARQIVSASASAAVAIPLRSTSARALHAVEPGVWKDEEGRFHAGGYSFTTIEQARFHAQRQWRGSGQGTPREQVQEARMRFAAAPSPRAESAVKPMREPERWIGARTTVRVNGVTFDAELTYIGIPRNKHVYPRNNALIDPNLPVAIDGDPHGMGLNYWPSYAELSQRGRRTYLEWLASGRSDPATPIGYIFIYFYGLERRLVHDRSEADAEAILAELHRLMGIYGGNYSFARYATALIEFGDILRHAPPAPLIPTLDRTYSYEIPLAVRIALGRLLADERPLDADQALCWLLALPDTYTRTPVNRCFKEFVALWRVRFAERYPDGLSIRPPKARIKVHYRAASGGYYADATIDGLPDIAQVTAPIRRLRELLENCTNELDRFSRLLGKSPDARGSLEAATLLPRELRSEFGAALQKCLGRLDSAFGNGSRATLLAGELLAHVEMHTAESGTISTQLLRQLTAILDALDIGFEPDRRYGTCGPLLMDSYVCVFRSEAGGSVASEAEHYVAARTLTEIAALAATADGVVVPLELEAIQRDLASVGLSPIEQARLLSHAEAILKNPPKARAAIKRLMALSEERRRRIVQSAISAVLADGHVLPSEVRFLEGLYRALGLPNEDVYAQLHRGSVEFDEPVSVAPAVAASGIPIPPESPSVVVDVERLERIRRETSQVSSLLATIFIEDAEPAAPASRAADTGRFPDLDAAHGDLLALLLSAPMERAEFEEAARERRLLPAGAIETINDWSFERFEEPVLDDEDMIIVVAHLSAPIRGLERRG